MIYKDWETFVFRTKGVKDGKPQELETNVNIAVIVPYDERFWYAWHEAQKLINPQLDYFKSIDFICRY